MRTGRHTRPLIILLLIASMAGSVALTGLPSGADRLGEIHKNITLFGLIYREIAQKYVEDVQPDKLMRVGVNAMLRAIDPYTVLIEEEDNEQFQIMTTGRYGGVGMLIQVREGWPTVVEPPYDNTPALRAGIREGDRIIEIDGESTRGKSVSEVASHLRGEIGTSVVLKVSRDGVADPLEFRLVRAEIVVKDVEYAGILEDGIGYIKLSRFSRNAANEVRDAVRRLRNEGMRALVFDLRNNPGGLLDAAVGVTDVFLPRKERIVSTKGRVPEAAQEYYSENDPIIGDLPMVVLVNDLSASASEIVAGALQDNDRAVIVGQQTFGKGLVQSVVGLTRESRLKLTTAKYYLPSGRLIQNDSRWKKRFGEDVVDHITDVIKADSTHMLQDFFTASGRKVPSGKGIVPDVAVPQDTLNDYEVALLRQSMIFNYAVLYANTHAGLKRDFEVSEAIISDFRRFLKDKEFSYKLASEQELEEFENALKRDGVYEQMLPTLTKLHAQIEESKKNAFDENIDFIKQQLGEEIAAKLWGTSAKIEKSLKYDKELQKAMELIRDQAWQTLLRPAAGQG